MQPAPLTASPPSTIQPTSAACGGALGRSHRLQPAGMSRISRPLGLSQRSSASQAGSGAVGPVGAAAKGCFQVGRTLRRLPCRSDAKVAQLRRPGRVTESIADSSAPLSSPAGIAAIRPVAGIDIGTNSIHLLVAAVDPALRSFSVLLTEKSTTRLGERDPETGDLSAEAIERAFTTLRHCRELAASHGVEPGDVVTAATSLRSC